MRALNNQLADFSGFLAAERGNLSQVLQVLPPALEDVASFVRDNRDGLHTDVAQLASITDILVRQQKSLTEAFDVAPLALGNLTNSYNASSGTLDVRPVLFPGLNLPALNTQQLLCGLLNGNPLGGILGGLTPAQLPTQVSQALTVCSTLTPAGGASLQTALAPFQQLAALLNANQTAAATVGNVLQNATTAVAPAPTVADQAAPTQPGQGLLQGLTTR